MKESSFIKNFIVLFSGNALAQVIPFLFAPFLARLFSEEDFAVYANFLAISSLAAIVAGGRLEFAYLLPKEDSKAKSLFKLSIKISTIVFLISFVILFFKDSIVKLYETKALNNYLVLVPFAILTFAFTSFFTQWLIRFKGYKQVSFSKLFQSTTVNIVSLIVGYYFFRNGFGLIIGWFVGMLTSLLLLVVPGVKRFNQIKSEKINNKALLKEYRDFPTINSLHAFSDIFFTQFLLFAILSQNFGMVALGLFVMMNKYLKAPIRVIGSAVGQVFYKEANDAKNNGLSVRPTMLKSIKLTVIFALPISLVLLVFGPLIFKLYLGEKWVASGEFAQLMALPLLFNFITSPISSTPLIFNKQKQAFAFSVAGYMLSVGGVLVAALMDLSMYMGILFYAISQSIFYISLILWYFRISK